MKKAFFIILVAASITTIGYFLVNRGKGGVVVKVIAAGQGNIVSTLSATGKVVSREEANVSTAIAGEVGQVLVDEGEFVAVGKVLALLADAELKARQGGVAAAVAEAEEKERQARREYSSLRAVAEVGGAARQTVEDAASNLIINEKTLAKVRAEQQALQATINKMTIVAPLTGIITRKNINAGEWAAPGMVLFSLAKDSDREVEVMVDESDGGLVKIDQEVELSSDAFSGRTWLEKVREVATAVRKEGAASSLKVRVSCGSDMAGLKIGQQVDARIRTASRQDVVKLPFDALIKSDGKTYVGIVRNEAVHLVAVDLGIEDAVSVEIIGGVSAGDEVIVPEGKTYKEGQPVKTIVRSSSRS